MKGKQKLIHWLSFPEHKPSSGEYILFHHTEEGFILGYYYTDYSGWGRDIFKDELEIEVYSPECIDYWVPVTEQFKGE